MRQVQRGLIHQSADDIGKAIGFSLAATSQALHRLRGQRLIWIDGYKQVRTPGRPIAVYRLNAPVIAVLLDEEEGASGQDLAEAFTEEGRT